jgi:hypothetical protein
MRCLITAAHLLLLPILIGLIVLLLLIILLLVFGLENTMID